MDFLEILGIKETNGGVSAGGSKGGLQANGPEIVSYSPVDNTPIASVRGGDPDNYEQLVQIARPAFEKWRKVPAPKRGQIVREIGDRFREYKEPLAKLISYEMGKIESEALGEVQEMIDIVDFSLGLSRQLYGLTMPSERPDHRMYEQWHPLGIVGIITAFNFPAAVWSWNALIGGVCGDAVIWKPSSKTPLTAIAIQNIMAPVVDKYKIEGVFNLIVGSGKDVGNQLVSDSRIPLISATGSCHMGRTIGQAVAQRLGRSLLELGGNNAIIITEDADLKLALQAALFSAVGTAGQRCTTTRRIIIHSSIKGKFLEALINAYKQLKIGDPLDNRNHMGPLVDAGAVDTMMSAIERARSEGGTLLYGGIKLKIMGLEKGHYVVPAIIETWGNLNIVREETFAPILYIMEYDKFEEAIHLHNDVPQGLSSAIFTTSLKSGEQFLSSTGSDCGIANINIGTTGAEIGGAFGGEKDTGGGRESGSDAWKNYMRRQTVTINYGDSLHLAQGIDFSV